MFHIEYLTPSHQVVINSFLLAFSRKYNQTSDLNCRHNRKPQPQSRIAANVVEEGWELQEWIISLLVFSYLSSRWLH